MGQKLTVIVTCTDRKTLRPDAACQARSLPLSASLAARHTLWRSRLAAASVRRPLGALYAGEAWSRTSHLMAAASKVGFDPDLWVASAGLGLVPSNQEAPGYAATLTRGHADSVATTGIAVAQWWRLFSATGGQTAVGVGGGGPVLIVASATYAQAMQRDLEDLAQRSSDALIVGGASQMAGLQRLPSDLGLRPILGGTASSLNLRMAEAWLMGLDQPTLTDAGRRAKWETWVASARSVDMPTRRPTSDTHVLDYLRTLRQARPTLGYSTALKLFRATGRACEQQRFAKLFAQAEIR